MKCHQFGGRTSKGEPCTRPAGWGRDVVRGPCKLHHRDADDQRRRESDENGDEIPAPPQHLSAKAARVWTDLLEDYRLSEGELLVLESALESYDSYAEARDQLRAEGPTVETPNGSRKRHPAALVARDSLRDFRSGLESLDVGLGELNI